MTFTKLPGFSIVITLSFQSVLIMGETFLAPEANKDSGLKIAEKRTNNFRVPMEMPYDPNFWPARGRRSRREPEKATQSDDCITEDGYIFDKSKIQCQDGVKIHEEKPPANGKLPPLTFELIPPIDLGDELMTGIEKTDNSCCGNGATASGRLTDQPKTRLGVKIPAVIDPNLVSPKRLDEIRHKKQKHTLLPQLIFYGNGVYWEPENLFGEKKKKQDVFWVARGKKYFNLNYPQK